MLLCVHGSISTHTLSSIGIPIPRNDFHEFWFSSNSSISCSSTSSAETIERAVRILHSSFVSRPLSASQLLIVRTERPRTNCEIFSRLARFPCHVGRRCGPRSGLLMSLLRVRHSISLNEAFLLIIGPGFHRSSFKPHVVIFSSEFPRA